MAKGEQELEVKFYLSDLPALEARLRKLGAQLLSPQVRETNLRFDTPEERLSSSGQALRLRMDTVARLTYKGPSQDRGGARLRQEIEFVIPDFDAAQRLFEALGFQVYLIYEKLRTTYSFAGLQVVLDRLPFGDFVEIEGDDSDQIRAVAGQLNLDWGTRIPESYTVLFEKVKTALSLPFRDLTFENFSNLKITAAQLGVLVADSRSQP